MRGKSSPQQIHFWAGLSTAQAHPKHSPSTAHIRELCIQEVYWIKSVVEGGTNLPRSTCLLQYFNAPACWMHCLYLMESSVLAIHGVCSTSYTIKIWADKKMKSCVYEFDKNMKLKNETCAFPLLHGHGWSQLSCGTKAFKCSIARH